MRYNWTWATMKDDSAQVVASDDCVQATMKHGSAQMMNYDHAQMVMKHDGAQTMVRG